MATAEQDIAIDEEALHGLLVKAVTDFGATWHAPLVVIGDRLGLYKALAEHGPLDSADLAERTETSERYVREWLRSQAAGGYIRYHADSERYDMSPEQALMLADENSPCYVPGAFQSAVATLRAAPKIEQAFRTGEGLGWHEHDPELFTGTERFFRPGYAANLVQNWLPALDGTLDKLKAGARVADVGCGHGASTLIMAEAFPDSEFIGFDYHDASVDAARERASQAGLSDRVAFEKASAKDYDGGAYDLVTVFDCLHDMGDPVGASSHIRQSLKPDGAWMIVEPFANDRVEDNLNPVGRAFYSVSTLVCTPCSLSQEVGLALGAQAGEKRLRDVATQGGFSQFRRATQTPFNLIFEARP
ncbi:Methyltransferase domain-containing protein [Modicisalibacter muralis]|uniref:Methyltransferase domain-containing protein n=1 Tax=Modicisalibacter muralis TaxID=119000 RepID=A0A1G9GSC2_9GAMM|nr:class I SAM-dependent methyltransferase [Halomonas muralis]SDL03590.1 Methyltransferase domain-containing protein [Halomonas muralis]